MAATVALAPSTIILVWRKTLKLFVQFFEHIQILTEHYCIVTCELPNKNEMKWNDYVNYDILVWKNHVLNSNMNKN